MTDQRPTAMDHCAAVVSLIVLAVLLHGVFSFTGVLRPTIVAAGVIYEDVVALPNDLR